MSNTERQPDMRVSPGRIRKRHPLEMHEQLQAAREEASQLRSEN